MSQRREIESTVHVSLPKSLRVGSGVSISISRTMDMSVRTLNNGDSENLLVSVIGISAP